MDNGIDRYLHKKFKKQLSIETRTNNNAADQAKYNDSVPTHSTNSNKTSVNLSVLNYVKSSISNSLVTISTLAEDKDKFSINAELDDNRNLYGEQSADISYVKVSETQTEPKNLVVNTSSSNLTEFPATPIPDETAPKQEITNQEKGTTGGKYVCTYCNLACSKPSVLQKHIRAHTNERPYPCVSCGFSFKTRSNLYKHCRSRTHANRVKGNKAQEITTETDGDSQSKPETLPEPIPIQEEIEKPPQQKSKPYKPRFHKIYYEQENTENLHENNDKSNPELITLHINDLIDKNNTIVNKNTYVTKRRASIENLENTEVPYNSFEVKDQFEPLNLTNKNRKRCLSETVTETTPPAQKSLIKELLLKNLYADSNMQCPHCKMIFQTVTELELHKLRNCKGMTKSGPRYSRSSSVNVASILTQNKNAFDTIPQLQNLKSPGPFLGKTRLVENDKTKSFSFEDGMQFSSELLKTSRQNFHFSPLTLSYDKVKKPSVKLFGGEVKITQTTGETKSFKIDGKDSDKYNNEMYMDYGGKMSENRVVKSTLQSGGTVLQSKPSYNKHESVPTNPDVIRVYENSSVSPSIDIINLEITKFQYENRENYENDRIIKRAPKDVTNGNFLMDDVIHTNSPSTLNRYTNIMDFSQNAVKMLAPNLKQLNLTIPGLPVPTKFIETSTPLLTVSKKYENPTLKIDTRMQEEFPILQTLPSPIYLRKDPEPEKIKLIEPPLSNGNITNPMNLIVNGKVVRYVPGIPGPAYEEETPMETQSVITTISKPRIQKPNIMITPVENPPPIIKQIEEPTVKKMETLEVKTELQSPRNAEMRSPTNKSPNNQSITETPKKFARPNSLALKPTMSSLKQHHGLTPTMFNQILISPDTPRGAKKYNEHFLHGNYFSYLGLKSSTKPVYCTLNKTQPFYVPHFKKLSMYSEWRQQDNKSDKLYVSGYDSRQKSNKYTVSGKYKADYIVHSSYKFNVTEAPTTKEDNQKPNSILGGYESNEDYTYVRGRGRGRYVCDQCGIRCKKPSMLKKHIRTHSNDRPYTCKHCNFSFKTKGNLTKHMKSKAHTKNYAANSNSSSSSAQQSGTPSSDSETEDSGMDSSDESSTRQQEHEAAYGLLSLSQKPTTTATSSAEINSPGNVTPNSEAVSAAISSNDVLVVTTSSFMNAEQLVHVSKTNYVKNKILDQQVRNNFNTTKLCDVSGTTASDDTDQSLSQYFGKCNISRPLTYPYTSINMNDSQNEEPIAETTPPPPVEIVPPEKNIERKNIIHFNVIKRYNKPTNVVVNNRISKPENVSYVDNKNNREVTQEEFKEKVFPNVQNRDELLYKKRKFTQIDAPSQPHPKTAKVDSEVMDLSMSQNQEKSHPVRNGIHDFEKAKTYYEDIENKDMYKYRKIYNHQLQNGENYKPHENTYRNESNIHIEKDGVNVCIIRDTSVITDASNKSNKIMEYDNSAMETLADIATKQEKLEKNSIAKNVASEFLKLATKNEFPNGDDKGFVGKDVNDLVVKTEENKSCHICSKNFSKPSQLRLHMNIHYLERPFRCESCSVSFRTKGHLQKHERSASHHNKLSSSPALASSEPRPFKCSDCNIAFRIHGHLAKHLRSKMHIMKLECLAKIPFGLYAELERSNSLLTEINTADGEQCLDSLKMLAKKVFINDPSKLIQLEERNTESIETDTDS